MATTPRGRHAALSSSGDNSDGNSKANGQLNTKKPFPVYRNGRRDTTIQDHTRSRDSGDLPVKSDVRTCPAVHRGVLPSRRDKTKLCPSTSAKPSSQRNHRPFIPLTKAPAAVARYKTLVARPEIPGIDVERTTQPSDRKQCTVSRQRATGQQDQSARVFPCAILPPPTSTIHRLSNEYIRCIRDFRMTISPQAFSACQLGQAPLLDAAAHALIQLRRHSNPATQTLTNKPLVVTSYSRAMSLARDAITNPATRFTESTISGISLLGAIDCLLQLHDPSHSGAFGHWGGLTALLLASPESKHPSETVRANIYNAGFLTMVIPTFTGQDSPFETPYWLALEPPSLDTEPFELTQLRSAGQRIGMSLPRLLRLTREVRTGSGDVVGALGLVEELFWFAEPSAEDWLLHRVRIVPTRDAGDKIIQPWSYEFKSLEELDAAVRYWQVLLILLRVRTVLRSYSTCSEEATMASSCRRQSDDIPSSTPVNDDQRRLATNLLMAWQETITTHAPFGTQSSAHGLMAVWGYLRQHKFYRDVVPRDVMGAWVLKSFKRCVRGTVNEHTMAEFDWATGVLEGGDLHGKCEELMGGGEGTRKAKVSAIWLQEA
ncbi:hypothetical protein LTR81_009680 [Elasticomyces elasticus]